MLEPTDIQRLSYGPVVQGRDVFGRSHTGSGKTLAFLLPAVQRMLSLPAPAEGDVSVVVLCNTKELCRQVASVARDLCAHGARLGDREVAVHAVAGSDGVAAFASGTACDILVATPGVPGPKGGGLAMIVGREAGAAARLRNVRTLVLDEADALTEGGFLRSVQAIIACMKLPIEGPDRLQLLIFSATLPTSLKESPIVAGRRFETADTVRGPPKPVGDHVSQYVLVVDCSAHPAAVAAVIHEHAAQAASQAGGGVDGGLQDELGALPARFEDFQPALHPALARALEGGLTGPSQAARGRAADLRGHWKALVFSGSGQYTEYMHAVLSACLRDTAGGGVHKIYGGMPPGVRKQVFSTFSERSACVLVSTDVSARGVDYPDLTLVIQVGFSSRTDYLQRSGRVGRAGAPGTSFAIFDPAEAAPALRPDCEESDDSCVGDLLGASLRQVPAVLVGAVENDDGSVSASQAEGLRIAPVPTEGVLPRYVKPAGVLAAWLGGLAANRRRLKITEDSALDWAARFSAGLGLQLTRDQLQERLNRVKRG